MRNINNNPCESCTAEFCENCQVSSAQPAQKNRVTQENITPELVEDEYDEFNRDYQDWEYLDPDWDDDPDFRDFGYPDDIENDYWYDYDYWNDDEIYWHDIQNSPPDQDTLSPENG